MASPAPAPLVTSEKSGGEDSKVGQLKVIGGLIALGLGLLTLLVVLGLSLISNVNSNQFTQLGTTVIGVVASIVGAYFGVKIGSDGTSKALEAQREEAARSQIFAAHLPPDLAKEALKLAFPPNGDAPAAPQGKVKKSKK